jgi:predicted AlkP superfamily phosphohydrolase/phosphomutase
MRVRMNSILIELGFLVPASGLSLLKDGLRRIANRVQNKDEQGFGIPIDWEKTTAFMPFQSCTGFIYLNLEGRQPDGSVKEAEFISLRDKLIEALRAYRDPKSGEAYFDEVAAMDEAHGWRKELLLPDIYVQPKPGIEFVRRAKRGEIAFPTKRPYAGLHDPDGLYILNGQGVKQAGNVDAHIADMAPTLLAALGQPVPSYMEGRVLNETFTSPMAVQPVPFAWDARDAGNAYTSEGAAAVEKRLADLGYLD